MNYNFVDQETGIFYDWDDKLRCYIAYDPKTVHTDDSTLYYYDGSKIVVEDTDRKAPEEEHRLYSMTSTIKGFESKLDNAPDVHDFEYAIPVLDSVVEHDEEPMLSSQADTEELTSGAVNSLKEINVQDLKTQLKNELINEAKQQSSSSNSFKRSMTRKLTAKLSDLGSQLSMHQQLSIISEIKREVASDTILSAEDIATNLKVEHAQENARRLAESTRKSPA